MSNLYPIDLHIHTVLSPCADLTMSPPLMLKKFLQYGTKIIAITDHNSVLNFPAFTYYEKYGILVIPGMELTTKEELHLLCLFENYQIALEFNRYVYENLQNLKNKPEIFGEQYIINEKEEIIKEEDAFLAGITNISLETAINKINELNGIPIPAHVDKPSFSITSQLGFIPDNLKISAIELFFEKNIDKYKNSYNIIFSSDAHSVEMIKKPKVAIKATKLSFKELYSALYEPKNARLSFL